MELLKYYFLAHNFTRNIILTQTVLRILIINNFLYNNAIYSHADISAIFDNYILRLWFNKRAEESPWKVSDVLCIESYGVIHFTSFSSNMAQ